MFQTFHYRSKYNLKSSIQLYDKIDHIQNNLSENIHLKYQIIKASSFTAYSWEIRLENVSEKNCVSRNCIIKTLRNCCLENFFVVFCARNIKICFCYRVKRKISHYFPQPFRIKQIKKSVQLLKYCIIVLIFFSIDDISEYIIHTVVDYAI